MKLTLPILCCLFCVSIHAQNLKTVIDTNGVFLKSSSEIDRIEIDGNNKKFIIHGADTLRLEIDGNQPSSIKLINTTTNSIIGMELDADGSYGFGEFENVPPAFRSFVMSMSNGIYRPAPNTVALATSNQERLRISPDGKIGIGTTMPSQKLDVAGRLRLRDLETDDFLFEVLVVTPDGTVKKKILPPGPEFSQSLFLMMKSRLVAQDILINQLSHRLDELESNLSKMVTQSEK